VNVPESPTITVSDYEAIRRALLDPALSRSFDKRSYREGNIRDGVVSISHGSVHRARRRIENSQFRPDRLRQYERELFPAVLDGLLDRLIEPTGTDIFGVGETVSVVLAARRAGLDVDDASLEELRRLVGFVDVFSQGSAILDARDPEAIRALVYATYETFERDFVRPAWDRRVQELADARNAGTEPGADDILTALLLHREEPGLELDDGRIVREVATYLQGGTHTSAQTLTNALDLVFAAAAPAEMLDRIGTDRSYAQRVVHEALRLRPTTPRIRRRAEDETRVGDRLVAAGATLVLDVATANRDPKRFGPDPDAFRPDRSLPADVPRWGLSFGAGAHQCPGRSVAGGFPIGPELELDDEHLFGLIAQMLEAVARRGVRPHPSQTPERDTRTERDTRWRRYPVRFTALEPAAAGSAGV
jgi:cytochrome P450